MALDATALGYRYLVRYYEGTCTRQQLDKVYTLGWITDDEYLLAVSGEPPIGYDPTPLKASDAERSAT